MELALIKSLMDKEFYDNHRGAICPDEIFSKDVRKIKHVVDMAIDKYNRSVTTDEIQALFMVSNPTMTTAEKHSYESLFTALKKENAMGPDIAGEVFSTLHRQVVGEQLANFGFDFVSGTRVSLEDVRNLIEKYEDNFIPNINIEWDDISLETILAKNDQTTKWKFNIPSLARRIEGINEGHLIMVGARSNVGKTSFHASIIAGPNGFARQGARCMILCNEESYDRVATRCVTAASGMDIDQCKANPKKAFDLYQEVYPNIRIKDSTNRDMLWVESVCKSYKPDVLVLDMGDKFANYARHAREDQALKANAIHCRQIAKQYSCAIIYMSQLSADAQDKTVLNQSMMEGSKTGKAAESDLMLLIAKSPSVEGQDEESPLRHINVVKNKLNGWHGIVNCELNYKIARYEK